MHNSATCVQYVVDKTRLDTGLDVIGTGFREANDIITGTLPGGASARPLHAPSFTLRAMSWRRRHATPTFEMRGRATLLMVEVNLVLRGVSVSRFYSGGLSAELPSATRPNPDGTTEKILCGTFTDYASRAAFAHEAWRAILSVFPDADTLPIHETFWAPSPHPLKARSQ